MVYVFIGQRIRNVRREKNISQQELAERANITKNHIYKIETATTKVSMEVLERICDGLNISLSQLFSNFEIVDQASYQELVVSIIDLLKDQPSDVQELALDLIRTLVIFTDKKQSEK